MKIQKRHIVLAALVLALGAAVYLNWQFNDNSDMLSVNTAKQLGEATYVNNELNDATEDEVISTLGNLTQEQQNYFSTAKTNRKQSQDEVLDIAKEVLQLAEATEEAKKEAAEQISKIEDYMLCQSNIESTLKAKGFSECLCFLSDEGCNVIVLEKEMKDNSPLIIKDIVTSQIEISFDDIKIIQK